MRQPRKRNFRRRMRIVIRRSPMGRSYRRVLRHLRRTIMAGVLLLVPIGLTYVVVRLVFDFMDGVLRPVLRFATQRWQVELSAPGVGIISGLVLVYVVGLVFANVLGRRVLGPIQALTLRVPLVGPVYSASRRLVESFSSSGTQSTGFRRVVMVEYPRSGAWTVGFLTGVTKTSAGLAMAVVYIPTAPTPTSGWVALVPFDQVLDTNLTVPQAMQLVLSGGIVTPDTIGTRPYQGAEEVQRTASPGDKG